MPTTVSHKKYKQGFFVCLIIFKSRKGSHDSRPATLGSPGLGKWLSRWLTCHVSSGLNLDPQDPYTAGCGSICLQFQYFQGKMGDGDQKVLAVHRPIALVYSAVTRDPP